MEEKIKNIDKLDTPDFKLLSSLILGVATPITEKDLPSKEYPRTYALIVAVGKGPTYNPLTEEQLDSNSMFPGDPEWKDNDISVKKIQALLGNPKAPSDIELMISQSYDEIKHKLGKFTLTDFKYIREAVITEIVKIKIPEQVEKVTVDEETEKLRKEVLVLARRFVRWYKYSDICQAILDNISRFNKKELEDRKKTLDEISNENNEAKKLEIPKIIVYQQGLSTQNANMYTSDQLMNMNFQDYLPLLINFMTKIPNLIAHSGLLPSGTTDMLLPPSSTEKEKVEEFDKEKMDVEIKAITQRAKDHIVKKNKEFGVVNNYFEDSQVLKMGPRPSKAFNDQQYNDYALYLYVVPIGTITASINGTIEFVKALAKIFKFKAPELKKENLNTKDKRINIITEARARALEAEEKNRPNSPILGYMRSGLVGYGFRTGLGWNVDSDQLLRGLNIEMEHSDITHGDPVMTAKIALAHLKEMPDYYSRLERMEGTGIYRDLANAYRAKICGTASRPLYDGEIHPLCANFEGPGTKIQLENVRMMKPYNNIDACAKVHDLAYNKAFHMTDRRAREKAVRLADEEVLKCFDKYKNEEPYYSIGKAGIKSKMLLENYASPIARSVTGNYYGRY